MRYLSLSFCLLLSVSFVNPTKNLKQIPRQGKDFALFFAVDDYRNHSSYNNLRNPIKDAKAIAKELSEIYGFEAKVYENPSRAKIFNALREWRIRSFDKDAQLFVFFSGHGEFDDFVSKGYFIPYDNNKIDLTDLGNIVTKIPCEHTLLAIDACYSGTIDQEIAFRGSSRFQRPGVTADTERQNIIQKQLRYKTRLLLTSGEKNRTPDGSNHSPFSNAILKKLRAAHTYGDGLVTFTDLLGEMERISPVPHQGELRGHEQGGFVFISSDLSNYKAKSPNSVEAQLKGDILHDLRDGKSYRTAVLNDGRRWMVENLDYDVAGSICCNFRRGTDGSCAQGRRHYYWRGGEGACPSGWHIPTYEEWAKFLEINGATKDNLGEIKIEGKIREYNEYGLIHIIDYWDYLGNQIVGLNLTGTVCNGKAHRDVQGLYLVKVDGTSYGSSPLLNFYCSGDNGYSYGCKVSLSKASDYKFMSDYATCVRCIQDIKN